MNQTTRPRRALAPALLAITLLAAACNNNDDTTTAATSEVVANTAPPTVLAPATTQSAVQSTTTTSEVTATSAPVTTLPIDEEAQAKQAVIAAAEHAWHVLNEAKLNPTDNDKVEAALAGFTGPAQDNVRAFLEQYQATGRRSVTSNLAPASFTIDAASVNVDEATGVATLTACDLDTNVMVETATGADGTDRVIDDSITSYELLIELRLVDGFWLYGQTQSQTAFEGALQCGED